MRLQLHGAGGRVVMSLCCEEGCESAALDGRMSTTARGIRIQGDPPLAFLRKLQQLEALVASIGRCV